MSPNKIFNAKSFPKTKTITLDQRNNDDDNTDSSPSSSSTPKQEENLTPVFLTPQTLITFPGASLAINIIWNVLSAIYEPFADMAIIPVIISLLIGVIIYSLSYTEPMSKSEKLIAMFVTLVNSLWLAAISLGINIGSPPSN